MKKLMLFLLACLTWGAEAGKSTTNVHEYTLKNGMKVIIKEDHRAPIAVSMVWYKVGSADEPGGITGVSHALEHMMFKGTPKYSTGVFSKTIAQNGGQENAFTNYDYTAYFEKVAADRLAITFKLEADRMKNLLLDDKEFQKEIEVIKEERRMRTDDNPQSLTFERFLAAAQLSSPYQHPVIGWMNDLNNLTISDLRQWYERWYTPNNATLVVVGDVDPKHTIALAKRYFGVIESQAVEKKKNHKEPRPLGKKQLEIEAPAKLPFVMMGYGVPSVKSTDVAWKPYALEIIAGILDNGDSARLAKQIIRGQQIASSVDVYYNMFARFDTQFILYGTPSKTHSAKELAEALSAQVNQLKTTLVPTGELKRVKAQIIAEKVFQKDSVFSQAMELGLLQTVGLPWQESNQYVGKLQAITPEQIRQVAQEYFIEKRLTIAVLKPQGRKS